MIDTRVPSNQLMLKMSRDILNRQSDISRIQEQIASGKRINRPSDNPSQSANIVGIEEAHSKLEQYQRNSLTAESKLNIEEASLTGTINTLNRIRELVLSSNNGALDDSGREAIKAEVALRLDELYDLANTKDSSGDYLFAGSNTQTRPFTKSTPVSYSGSDDAQSASVGLGRTIKVADSGIDVFMRIRNGNGDFQVSATNTNTGTGLISAGSVVDRTAFTGDPYRIEFTSSDQFNIIDVNSGTALQSGVAYTSRSKIEFGGINTSIIGSPNAGDTFDIKPSTHQDIFTTVSAYMDSLDNPHASSATSALFQQDLNEALLNIDNSLAHLNTARSRVGNRLNSIDSSREENESITLQLSRSRANIEDLDIAKAVTELQSKATSLEILQKSFVRVEGLNLFNYM